MQLTGTVIVLAAGFVVFSLPAAALGASNTYVKAYADFIGNTSAQKDVTPYDIQNTSDGGYILLGAAACTTQACLSAETGNNLVNWVVKIDSSGNPQWQKEVGCFSLPPGDTTIGASIQQTTDGGYIIGGGTVACGQPPNCGGIYSLQCGIVEKLDSGGNLVWAKTYLAGPNGSEFLSIKQTTDGGYVAAGGASGPGTTTGAALVVKLDDAGTVQWQRTIGPEGRSTAIFNAIQQTSDGGYVATGDSYTFSAQCQPFECEAGLVVKLDKSGNVQWQEALITAGSAQTSTNLLSIIQTSDGSYVVAGAWGGPTEGGAARLLVKLDPTGGIVWQQAYRLEFNLGSVIYSVHQTSDGGYALAGDGDILLDSGIHLEPWIGKVDATGNPVWQHRYFQGDGEYFASSALAADDGVAAVGWTKGANLLKLLFVVQTDSSGLCGANCSAVHPAEPFATVNPGLTVSPLSLPAGTVTTPGMSSPGKTRSTAIKTRKDC